MDELIETLEVRQLPIGHQLGMAIVTTAIGAAAAIIANKFATKGYESLLLEKYPVKTFTYTP